MSLVLVLARDDYQAYKECPRTLFERLEVHVQYSSRRHKSLGSILLNTSRASHEADT